MKKTVVVLIVILLIAMPLTGANAEENDIDENVSSMLSDIDIEDLNEYFKEFDLDISAEEFTYQMSQGNFASFSQGEILNYIFDLLSHSLKDNIPNFILLFVVIIILSLMRHFTNSFKNTDISDMGIFAGDIIVSMIIAVIVFDLIYSAQETVQHLSDLISVLSPILLPLLIALGGYSSNAVLTPAIASFNSIVVAFFNYFVFPLIIVCIVMTLISSYSKNSIFNGFSDFISGFIKWMMGIVFVVFLGIIVIQGSGAAGYDGISVRTAKYTIDKTIPVVGGMFSDSFDTMIVCSSIVKNAIGVTGLLICAMIIVVPAVKIIANILIIRGINVFLSPYSTEKNTALLNKTSDVMTLGLIAVLMTGIMVFMLISMIIGAGNINIMMR